MSGNSYPSDWDSRRKKVYQRDGYECQNCGINGGPKGNAELHAHHVVPKAKGGTHDTTNLITICKECHNAVHGNKSAPKKRSSKNTSTERIRDISGYGSIWKQVVEQRNLTNNSLAIPASDMKMYSDYDVAQESEDFVRECREIRGELTKYKFRLENMELDYDKLVKSGNIKDRSEFQTSIERSTELILEEIDLLLYGINITQEYLETIGSVACPKCDNKSDHQHSFCGECGEALPDVWTCSSCGVSIETRGQNFCRSCGSEVSSFPETQEVKLNSLKQERDRLVEQLEAAVQKTDDSFKNVVNISKK